MKKNRHQRRAEKSAPRLQVTQAVGNVLDQIDPLILAAVKIETIYNETLLANATGFFYSGYVDGKPNFWLVTNWHVITGRNADDPMKTLDDNGCVPNRIRLRLILKFDQPEYLNHAPGQLFFQDQTIELYDGDGQADWFQHPTKNKQDVAVLNASVIMNRAHLVAVSDVSNANDMAVHIGNQIFILGYPLGFTHFINTPICKSGCIASEPHLETPESGGRVVIDATTRQGMSGSPVFMREKTHYLAESGEIKRRTNATRFIGIYSSRPNILVSANLNDEDRRAEVGFYFKSSCVHEAIVNGIRGPNFGECP
jgi:hypothetical protein